MRFLKIFGLILSSIIIFSCSSSTPKCSDEQTKELVIRITKDQLKKVGLKEAVKKLEFDVINIRTANYQKEIDKYTCKADLIMKKKGANNSQSIPIMYTVQKTDDEKSFYVEVYGL